MKSASKIVVLEDDRSTRGLITGFLEKAGYQVYEASEGRYAIELVMQQRPALLIADIMLPDMDGAEVVKMLLETSNGANLKVLFLTSLLSKNGIRHQETKLKVAGNEFPALSKPFNPKVLISIANRLVGEALEVEEAAAAKAKAAIEAQAAMEASVAIQTAAVESALAEDAKTE